VTYRQNETAIGIYRTEEGEGISFDGKAVLNATGFAAFDALGHAWRVTEAEATAIAERRKAK
jgi:hypothetical protein